MRALKDVKAAKAPTRRAFSERMKEYGSIDKDFVVFEADIGYSTYSYLFGEAHPERYFNMGIAEGNMVSAAAGMAAEGRKVVASSYGVFLTMRALESVRTYVCYPNLNVKFLSSHGGFTPAIDGVTHQATEDIANMTTLPNMKVICPADTISSRKLFDVAIETTGPVFIRLMRDPYFDLYEDKDSFHLGGSAVVREGKDITIVAYGDIVFEAVEAAAMLEKDGISAEVIDMYSIKPFDRKGLLGSIEQTGALLVVENHQKRNGLGYELSNFCIKHKPIPFDNLGLDDTFAESGDYFKLLEKYGLSKIHIAKAARQIVEKKG
ncbi:MAG: transketolase family protein [Deltaproteobacteria bacterium]|nr:transketolase family protein [Deltaproteobacteria bacterium]